VTPQEATDKLFEAAKSGDTAAAQAAIDAGADFGARVNGRAPIHWAQANGHDETAKLLGDIARTHYDKIRRGEVIASNIGSLIGAITIAAIAYGSFRYYSINQNTSIDDYQVPNKQPVPKDVEAVQLQVRNMLKDSATTDHFIEQLKNNPSMVQKLTDDPDIMRNMRKLADAIEGNAKERPANWTDKATHGNGAQSPGRD